MQAETPTGADVLPRSRKARALLAYLCLAEGRPVPRARLAGELWERVTDAQARVSLRQALLEIGRALGSLRSELLVLERDAVRLRTDRCWIDAWAALRQTADGLESDIAEFQTERLLEGLDGLSAGFDQWLRTERTRFAETLRESLEAELHQATASEAAVAERAAAARRVIAFDPTHEGACRALMCALAERGERALALKEYARCRDALRLTLETEPSGETRALYEAIKSASSGLGHPSHNAIPDRNGSYQPRPADPDGSNQRLEESARGRLRVGVSPFVTIGSGVESALAFNLAQEIASALARFHRFDVVAPSVLGPRAQAFDLAPQDQSLGYVVDGTLTAAQDWLQVSVRLLHISGFARPVWSEKFETSLKEIGRLDEIVTARVAARIDPVILFREAKAPSYNPLSATALTVRAMPMLYSMERSTFEEAGRLLEEAIRREPDNALALAWSAYWGLFHLGQGWARDVEGARKQAHELGLRALRLDPDDAEVLAIYGHLCSYLHRDFGAALRYFERALRLNSNLGLAWALSAATSCYIGEPEAAVARLDHYRKLTPLDPYFDFFEAIYANARMLAGDYEQAVQTGRRTVRVNPDFVNGYRALIASLGHLGRLDEAAHYRDLLARREPDFSIERFVKSYPLQREADRERFVEGFRRAGVPETEGPPRWAMAEA